MALATPPAKAMKNATPVRIKMAMSALMDSFGLSTRLSIAARLRGSRDCLETFQPADGLIGMVFSFFQVGQCGEDLLADEIILVAILIREAVQIA